MATTSRAAADPPPRIPFIFPKIPLGGARGGEAPLARIGAEGDDPKRQSCIGAEGDDPKRQSCIGAEGDDPEENRRARSGEIPQPIV
jgi:hypothetical protein